MRERKPGFDAKNLSFQLVDVTQGLASGQPVFQIFAQQAGQIGQIIGTSPQGLGGLMKELGSAIARVLTPMRLLTAGVVGLGATITAAVLYWKNYALQLDDTRKVAGETSAAISGLNSAAAIECVESRRGEQFAALRDRDGSCSDFLRIGIGETFRQPLFCRGKLQRLKRVVSDGGRSGRGNGELARRRVRDLQGIERRLLTECGDRR